MRCSSAVEVLLPDYDQHRGERLVLQCMRQVEDGADPGSHAGPCSPGEVRFTWRHNPAGWAAEPSQVEVCSTCGMPKFPHPRRHPFTQK